jgi:prepilin signal peptidase PulO-like enzyme (type II secretory pathway)
MTMRTRKLIGTAVLLVWIVVYSFAAVAVAIILQMQSANKALELVYYVVAGTLWIIPAGAVIWWMQKPDEPAL